MINENDYPKWFIQKARKKRKAKAQVKLKREERYIEMVFCHLYLE